jgi:LacI family transcriptional regulator
MATMKDIAKKLGISLSTVSKGLNVGQDISDALRRTILDTAVELGYQNRKAVKKDRRRIAVFIENMDYEDPDSFGYEIVLGFQMACFQGDCGVSVLPLTKEFQKDFSYDAWMLQEKYSGAMFMGISLDDPWASQMKETAIPTVLLDNFIPDNPRVCTLSTDSGEGMETALAHLAALGHEKIAFLDGSAGSMVSDRRMVSYLSSMAAHQLPIDPMLAVYGYFVAEAAPYHVPGFLDAGATAILCGNDLIASGVIECCRERGFRVPEDISVIGFDDLPLAEKLDPPLTTVRQDRSALGRMGCYALFAMIGQVPLSGATLRPRLVVRSSTAPARPRVALRRSEDKDSVAFVNPDLYLNTVRQRHLW